MEVISPQPCCQFQRVDGILTSSAFTVQCLLSPFCSRSDKVLLMVRRTERRLASVVRRLPNASNKESDGDENSGGSNYRHAVRVYHIYAHTQ